MSMNATCPKCGSQRCELKEKKTHGVAYWIFLGWWLEPIIWIFKLCAAFCVFFFWDIWYNLIMLIANKEKNWVTKLIFVPRKAYYCHDCGNNFKA